MWIARNKNGKLFLYKNKPHKYIDFFLHRGGSLFYEKKKSIEIKCSLFPKVTFENSPKKIIIRPLEKYF